MHYMVETQGDVFVMTEDEFKAWLEMFMADQSLGSAFKVVRGRRR